LTNEGFMIQLHRLEGFYWVARSGGYARAARAFPYPITQPAVHQQVKKLEGELEIALFERVGKDRMQLTPAGKRLYEFVRPFFEKLPGLARSLKQGDYGGDFHVQTASLLLRNLLPAWVKRVHRRWPEIRVHLRETQETDLEPLRSGEVDLIVDYLPEIPDDLASVRVATVRPCVVRAASPPRAKRAKPTIEALADVTFIS
jgi:DNA-binding transcriptional LysR family regulator